MKPTSSTQKILIIITANHGALSGCDDDGRRMASCLSDFETWWCTAATRAKVFALFGELRRELRPGAVLVIYLSGHGGWARFRGGLSPDTPTKLEWPFFVTADQPHDAVFNSLLAVELSMFVAWCVRITKNVTVITDACFAPELVRAEPRLKSTGRHEFAVPTHLVADYDGPWGVQPWVSVDPSSRRQASLLDDRVVCVNATGAEQSAYEIEDEQGRAAGAFSTELFGLLDAARAHRSCWQHLVCVVDQRLAERWGEWFQRPEVTGRGGRRVLELDSVPVAASTRYFVGHDGAGWLRSGRIHGTNIGDTFTAHGAQRLVNLEVLEVREDRSRVVATGDMPESGSLAYPHPYTRQLEVAIAPTCPERDTLTRRLASAIRLRPCAPGGSPVLRVGAHREGLAVWSGAGQLLLLSCITRVFDDLDALARAYLFEEVCARVIPSPQTPEWDFRVWHCRAGSERALAQFDCVAVEDQLWVELANHSIRELPRLYVNVVERGVDGCLRVLNRSHYPTGVPVAAGTARRVLWYPEGPRGRARAWPTNVPQHQPRIVQWYFVASPVPIDLRSIAVEHEDTSRSRAASQHAAALQSPLATRRVEAAIRGAAIPSVSWSCRRLSHVVNPIRVRSMSTWG